MDTIENIKNTLDTYRNQNIRFISVTNSEWYSLFRDEIRNSIAIEGIFANRNELLFVLEQGRHSSNQKTAAILGYFEAASTLYEYAENQYRTGEFEIRLSDLKQIHTLLMRYEHQLGTFTGNPGGFRKSDVTVTNSSFTPLNYMHLENVLPAFICWINENIRKLQFDILTFSAASHILFETIHPFRDGNGRVGRILLSYLLIGSGLVNIAIKGTTKADRNIYYQSLEVGDECVEKLLRYIEKGKRINVQIINDYISDSNLEPLKRIIQKRLIYSFKCIEKGMKTSDSDALIPLREAAKYYNYSQDYLRQLIHLRKLPGVKRGKLWYIKVRDIEKYSKNQQ
ncbi:MAG: Fic family protein [Candidatus Marinimicrobia bacterium]|nr:Fic family protein [Candidatus Neomarinimicrobiota bacterium]